MTWSIWGQHRICDFCSVFVCRVSTSRGAILLKGSESGCSFDVFGNLWHALACSCETRTLLEVALLWLLWRRLLQVLHLLHEQPLEIIVLMSIEYFLNLYFLTGFFLLINSFHFLLLCFVKVLLIYKLISIIIIFVPILLLLILIITILHLSLLFWHILDRLLVLFLSRSCRG